MINKMIDNQANSLEDDVLDFLSKEVNSVEDLKKHFSDDLEIRKGKNEEKELSPDTEILIVGTAIPPDIAYFFTGKDSWIYKVIDRKRKTNLSELQTRLNAPDGHLFTNDYVEEIKQILRQQKIDFLDITNLFLTTKKSHRDKDIVCYLVDYPRLKIVKDNQNRYKKIIPITRKAEAVLKRRLGITNAKYEQFFVRDNNKSMYYKKLRIIQQKWYNLL